ncbi:MAG: SDR family oxidoreductase [Acidimicrobiia bacterium]
MKGTIVVTGAARGIGRAITERLTTGGPFTVVAADISPELASIEGNVVQVETDLTTEAGLASLVEAVVGTGSELIGLVNNAGITRDSRLVNMSVKDFKSVLDVNLGVSYRLSKELAPLMSDGGSIVNIASRAYLGNFGQFNYSMSKGGVVGLTRSMALSLAPHLRVNAIAPGLIGTEMAMAIPEDVLTKMVSAIPLDRMGTPGEIADVAWFLLTPLSSYITGEVIVVGGGRSLS